MVIETDKGSRSSYKDERLDDIPDKRLLYIDNLRVLLIILVIIVHAAAIYGPIGFWYYFERTNLPSTYILAFFNSFNQSFVLGLFFMISAYFIPLSYYQKGPTMFIRDRLKRLGIPLLFYVIFIGPTLIYINRLITIGENISFYRFYLEHIIKNGHIDMGPLWFIQALLIFIFSYLVIIEIFDRLNIKYIKKLKIKFPPNYIIFVFTIFLAAFSFLIRKWFPIGTVIGTLQLSFFPQYILFFTIGIIAYHQNWFAAINRKRAVFWFWISSVTTTIWPLIVYLSGAFKGDLTSIAGGWHWQSSIYALWEAIVGVGIIICLLYLFKTVSAGQNRFQQKLSGAAYTVFIIHPIIITALSYAIRDFDLHPLLKFIIVAAAGVTLCFLIGNYIRKIPLLRAIL